MARQPRFSISGIPQHTIQRGNNREPCFYAEDDYLRYKNDLFDAAKKNQATIHAYVLMTSHVHLLVTPQHAQSIKVFRMARKPHFTLPALPQYVIQ